MRRRAQRRRQRGAPKLYPVTPFAYDLTSSASTSAAYWRSSALAGPLRQLSAMDSDMGSGKMSSSPFSTPSKMGSRNGLRRGLRYVEVSGHIRVPGAGQDGMYPHAPSGQRARSDCDRENAAAFEIE
jgi:hypothetical protein